jgi:3',5'-cyclic AMP phosphodiesterase CpdA
VIVLAHLSDTHFDGSATRAERARAVMNHLDGLPRRPDAIVVSGDIADHGLREEYLEARSLLVSDVPVLTCPGNHDVREGFRRWFLDLPGTGAEPVNQRWALPGLTVALCDSSIPGRADGHLADETLAWLDAALSDPADNLDVPAIVGFHHPPVPLHVPFIDEIRQHGAERLAAVLDRHPRVVAVLAGHAHTPAASAFAGRPLLVAPGVVSTLRFPWEPGEETIDYSLPPALAYHVLDGTRITTHFRVVPVPAG